MFVVTSPTLSFVMSFTSLEVVTVMVVLCLTLPRIVYARKPDAGPLTGAKLRQSFRSGRNLLETDNAGAGNHNDPFTNTGDHETEKDMEIAHMRLQLYTLRSENLALKKRLRIATSSASSVQPDEWSADPPAAADRYRVAEPQ